MAEPVQIKCVNKRDSIYRFLAIGQFDKDKDEFVDWFEENPFAQERYWK